MNIRHGLEFVKMHGAGNDFVVLDAREQVLPLDEALYRRIADRHFGIGCDQVVVLSADEQGADTFVRFYNPDGSEAGACGNATRCVASFLAQETGAPVFGIRTIAGLLEARMTGPRLVSVDMGAPRLGWDEIPLAQEADTLHLRVAGGPFEDPAACSMGNPHATFFLPGLEELKLETINAVGPGLERHRMFPERANIGFAVVESAERIRLKVWERGAGLTLACGSGACAALVNAHRRGLTGRCAEVVVDGGRLRVSWRESDGHVLMEGPAETAFAGVFLL